MVSVLAGIKRIYDDVRNLSEHLDHDVEVRNSDLNVLAKKSIKNEILSFKKTISINLIESSRCITVSLD